MSFSYYGISPLKSCALESKQSSGAWMASQYGSTDCFNESRSRLDINMTKKRFD